MQESEIEKDSTFMLLETSQRTTARSKSKEDNISVMLQSKHFKPKYLSLKENIKTDSNSKI